MYSFIVTNGRCSETVDANFPKHKKTHFEHCTHKQRVCFRLCSDIVFSVSCFEMRKLKILIHNSYIVSLDKESQLKGLV